MDSIMTTYPVQRKYVQHSGKGSGAAYRAMYKHMSGRRDIMTQEELEEELVWDKLQTGDYIDIDGKVYEMETGELICENMS
jgi:hypothetical protein